MVTRRLWSRGSRPSGALAKLVFDSFTGFCYKARMTITLPPALEKQLETAARARGLDVDAYARAVLERAAQADRAALLAEIDRVRAMTPDRPQTDSGELLQRSREERYGR
jgi:hypothetical protein